VGRTRISSSDTPRGLETAKAMICATSSAVIDRDSDQPFSPHFVAA